MGNVVDFRWNSGSDSPDASYRLEIGRQPGASGVAVHELGDTSFAWEAPQNVSADFFARVRGVSGGTPSNEVIIESRDLRKVVDAMFFGQGAYAVPGTINNEEDQRLNGFRRGRALKVLALESIEQNVIDGAITLANQLEDVAGLGLRFTFARSGNRAAMEAAARCWNRRHVPQCRPGGRDIPPESEVWFFDTARIEDFGCAAGSIGCATSFNQRSAERYSAVIVLAENAFPESAAHELGHAVGFRHLYGPALGLRAGILMDGGPFLSRAPLADLSSYELTALQAVIDAGMAIGTHRRDFIALGLVPP